MPNTSAPAMFSVQLPTVSGQPLVVPVGTGQPTLILGANGTGKSALVHRFVTSIGGDCVYLPGSRPSYFDNESLSITPAARQQLTSNFSSWDRNPTTRYRSISGTQRNEKAIYDLQAAELQFKLDAANEIERDGAQSTAIALLQSQTSPLDRANHLLRLSNLPIQLAIDKAELTALRSGKSFSLAKMSDGERAAVIVIAEVKSAKPGSIFIIDEPELHLHRSIVVPMLKALISERTDCAFVISTHELALAEDIEDPQVLLVRGCTWSGDSVHAWDLDLLSDTAAIPDDIRTDVMGSRRSILFVEGTTSSLDRPLYSLLFPNTTVQPKETCRDVRRAVEGLKSVSSLHHAEAHGLIDSDGMSPDEIEKLEANGIYPLPFYAVESLYYMREVRRAVAVQQAVTLKLDVDTLMRDADNAALQCVSPDRVSVFSGRIALRRVRDALLNALPDLQTIQSDPQVNVSVPSDFGAEKARLEAYLAARDVDAIIERYPVRESGALGALARALRLQGRGDYERAALARIESDAALRDAVRNKLGKLALALA